MRPRSLSGQSRLIGHNFQIKSIFGFLVSTIIISNFSSAYAQTETNPTLLDSGEALAADAKLYAEAYGVSYEEAAKRLSIMFDIGAEADAAESEEGDDFAGSYFDNSTTQFSLVVRTKKANKPDRILKRKARAVAERDPAAKAKRRAERKAMRAKLKLTDNEVEQAEDILAQEAQVPLKFKGSAANSVQVLQAAIDASAQSLAAIPGFQNVFVDNKTGEVVLMVDAKSPDVASAEAAKFLKVPYRIELVPGGFVNVALRGGQFSSVAAGRWCLTAFAAKHNTTGKTGVVTAGHCVPPNPPSPNPISLNDGGTNYVMTQGTTLNRQPAGDLMFLSGTPTAVAEFYYDGTGVARSVTGTRSRASTAVGNGTLSTAGTTTGSFVCHLGQQTPGSSNVVQSCGEVISTTNNGLTTPSTGGSYVVVRNTQSGAGTVTTSGTGTLLCFRGDSGGPWFSGTIAFGVMSGCAWQNGVQNGTTLYSTYTSVDAFPSIGVTILVK
ncbi:hypothetical protein [Altericista sp. CCNU0014]|uniref:hypothetical protein n=1 Tax=Altericista sp. CCNU0014 TaxID=3082949 RepID=UPI00385179C0